ncbi:MAG: MmgE/PrpD family protein [Pseudolabrys sp.]
MLLGSEICCRIGVGAPGEFHKRGFHPTGVVGAFGAAGGAGKALRLDRPGMISAMGLAASMGSGIMQSWVDGTDARYIHNGHSAMAGLLAAQLAQSE